MRASFDEDAAGYDQARPGYPEALFADLVQFAALSVSSSLLEIGSGTGKATLPLARRGYRILGVELGEKLAALARQHLAAYPGVTITTGNFEEIALPAASFDLVFSATAFHWIDPAIGYPTIARILKPSGTLALFWNMHVQSEASRAFFEEVQALYRIHAPALAAKTRSLPRPDEVPEPVSAEIEQTGFFGPVTVRRYVWEERYTADSYIALLSTYSDHRVQAESERRALFQAIGDLINTHFAGQITKGYLSLLYLAQRQ